MAQRHKPHARHVPTERQPTRFSPSQLYEAARLYWNEDATQAEIAEALGTSRPTVSRLLAEAREAGIVHIEIRKPSATGLSALARELTRCLGIRSVRITPPGKGMPAGRVLAGAVGEALRDAGLGRGDALLVSSGSTVHGVSQEALPNLPGVLVAPTVGGQNEIDSSYQTNEITRRVAVKIGGTPVLLHAPALPGPELREWLIKDPQVRQVLRLWKTAKCALLGVGAPPLTRTSLPSVLPTDPVTLRNAVGDICVRPYDAQGTPIPFPGSDRLIAMDLAALTKIQHTIAIAIGENKITSIRAAARAGYFNTLVTDVDTANALLGSCPEPD